MTGSKDDPLSTGAGFGVLGALTNGDERRLIGRELDGYKITEFLAEGGMSRVYRASRIDGSFERDVAIKLSATSSLSSTMRDRFMQEQSVLAGLNHANISQLYDARLTEEGWPYIVMELIEGSPITRFCEANALGVNEKVQLLIDVVDAVGFAHANLVVHRDIKPSNVLVTSEGTVKLLDFGIAKLLEDETGELTRAVAMTPQYASPEQLLGRPISIASDIYQLGLLAAEVLFGKLPTEGEALTDAIERSVDGRAVTLQRGRRNPLPRELVLILEQCLRTEPSDRYRDANALRRDLEAYLMGYPVSAAGQRPAYRFRKFVQRNRGGVFGALLTLVALLSATVITGLQMLEAKQQRDLAVYQQQRVQASNEFYGLLLEEMGDGSFTSVDLLDRGRNLLETQFDFSQPFMAAVLFDVARRYGGMGERQREAELLEKAAEISREHRDEEVLAAVLCRKARGNLEPTRAAEQLVEGLAIYSGLRNPGIDTSVECLRARSQAELTDGQSETSLQTLFTAKDLLDAHPAPGANLRGIVLNDISLYYYRNAQPGTAIQYLEQILELLATTGRGATLGYQRVAANRAVVLQSLGRTAEALDAFADLYERMEVSNFQGRGAAPALAQYGDTLLVVRRLGEAEAVYTQGLAIAEADGNSRIAAFLEVGLAKVDIANRAFDSAMRRLDAARAHANTDGRVDRRLSTTIEINRVKVLRGLGDLDGAAREIDVLLVDSGYPEAEETPGMVSALIEGAEVYRQRGEFVKAFELVTGAIARLQEHIQPDESGGVHLGRALIQRAEIQLQRGAPDDAVADIELGLSFLVDALGTDHEDSQDARALLAVARSES